MAAESERSPCSNGASGQSRVAQDDSASRRSASESDMTELPRSTSIKSQAQATIMSQLPKFSSTVPGISAPASTTSSTVSSRETSPVRSSLRASNSNSTHRVSSRSRKGSHDRSPPRSVPSQNPGPSTTPSATAVQRALSQTKNPPILSPPAAEPSPNAPSPEKSNMLWAATRRPEQDTALPNISTKRSLVPSTDDNTPKVDRITPRAVNRGINGSGPALETVQEMASDPSTPSTDTGINQPPTDEPRLQRIDEDTDTTPTGAKQNNDSGSESGGNKSSGPVEQSRRRASSQGNKRPQQSIVPKRSTTSLSGTGARGKPADGSVRNMIVETETVSSIPQVSLGVATGDRSNSGRADTGTLRMKPSTETIRPKKEKKRTRKPAALTSGAASSKADIFEAKVASAVDEADVSDSDETFVYESNPPDPYPVRQQRYHSRTPSATSMASQVDQLAGRVRNHSVTGKRSMKFTNNTYNSSVDGEAGEEASRSHPRVDGTGTQTPRHHHIKRYGRNNMYPSLFDNESPFPPPQPHVKSPRHFVGSGFRQPRHNGSSRNPPNYRTISNSKKAGDVYGYDYDAEGADDERTPLVGTPRVTRSRHSGRRPNSASLRQMEYMQQRQRGYFSKYGTCLMICLLLLLFIGGVTSFVIAITKPLVGVKVLDIQNVLASEQEIMLDLHVQAINPNIFPVAVDDMDINIFAKSRYVGTESMWRDESSDSDRFPRVERSRKRAQLAQAVRSNSSDQSLQIRNGGVDKGTDPIPNDPTGDPQTMLLGRVFRFDSPLAFDPSPWNYEPSNSKGQIRLSRPGNKTEEGGSERWERVLQHSFDLIVRGVIKYQLPLSSRYYSASVSSKVQVIPDHDDDGHDGDHDGDHDSDGSPGKNDTVLSVRKLSRPKLLPVRLVISNSETLETRPEVSETTGRAFKA